MNTTDAMIDFDKIDRDVRRLRAQATADMITYVKGWFAARRSARKATRPAAKPATRTQTA